MSQVCFNLRQVSSGCLPRGQRSETSLGRLRERAEANVRSDSLREAENVNSRFQMAKRRCKPRRHTVTPALGRTYQISGADFIQHLTSTTAK